LTTYFFKTCYITKQNFRHYAATLEKTCTVGMFSVKATFFKARQIIDTSFMNLLRSSTSLL